MPTDLVLCNANVLADWENSVQEFVAEQQERFRSAYQVVRNHLRTPAQKRKAYYDTTVRSKQFNIGDRVWYFYPRKYIKRSRKWGFTYVGPYEIVQKLSELTYAIRKTNGEKPNIVHIDKLKKCVSNDMSPNVVHTVDNVASVCSQAIQLFNMDPRDRPFACEFCEQYFVRNSDSNRHNRDVHEKVKIACTHCDVVLGSRRAWKRHNRNIHEKTKRRNRRDLASPTGELTPSTAVGPAEEPCEAVVVSRRVRWISR